MTNKMLKGASLAGFGFCLLAGAFLTGGDSARAEGGAAGQAANRAGQYLARDVFGRVVGQTFRQSFNLRDIAVGAANGASASDSLSDSFAAFRRDAQLRLLAAVDDELRGRVGNVLRENFDTRKAEIDFQTKLGGRKGHLGVNVIGAFAERADDAFGWQVRAYAGQEESTGFNSGVFYRKMIENGMLVGGNFFADYEKHKHGNFLRYSLGGELQNKHFSLAANYYAPITDERHVNSTIVAFSRRGYDAKLRVQAPRIDNLRAAVDYYHFDGKLGTEAENGFRYGVELIPIPALQVGVYHDSESEKFGGNFTWTHTVGEVPGRGGGGARFAPDMFAPVWREHSQRIALATLAAPPGFVLSVGLLNSRGVLPVRIPSTVVIGRINGLTPQTTVAIIAPAGLVAAAHSGAGGGAISPAAAATVFTPVSGFRIGADGVVEFAALRTTPTGTFAASIIVERNVAAFTIDVIPPPMPTYNRRGSGFLISGTRNIGVLSNAMEWFDEGTFSLSVSGGGMLTVDADGNTMLTTNMRGVQIITVVVTGTYGGEPSSFAFTHTIRVLLPGEPHFEPAERMALRVGVPAVIGALSITTAGYFDSGQAVDLSPGAVFEGGNIVYTPAMAGEQGVTISVTGIPASLNVFFSVTVSAFARIAITTGELASMFFHDDTAIVGTVGAVGGIGDINWRIVGDDGLSRRDETGELVLATPPSRSLQRILRATIIASDSDDTRTPAASLFLTMTVVPLTAGVVNYRDNVALFHRLVMGGNVTRDRIVVGTVSVLNPDPNDSVFTYSLVAASGSGGDGTGEIDTLPNCDTIPDCRYYLNTSTGELEFYGAESGAINGTIVAKGMSITVTAFATVHAFRMGSNCSYSHCPPAGILGGTPPTTAQISILMRLGFPISGASIRLRDGNRGAALIPFFAAGYDQTRVSVMWDHMVSLGADANQDFQNLGGEGSGMNNFTALDFANQMNDEAGRLNWFTGAPGETHAESTLQRCNYICRIGQRQRSNNAVCLRDTSRSPGQTTPTNCAVANP